MSLSISKISKEKNNIFIILNSIIISLVPICYMVGNSFLNLNITLILVSGIFLYFKGFRIKLNFIDKAIVFLFFFIIFNSIWNTIENYINEFNKDDYTVLLKSFLYLRYLILYFAIRLFVDNNIINFKIIFFTYSALLFSVCIDIFYQFYNGKNLLGLVSPFPVKTTGIFYDEAIAGSFIQRFSFFILYLFPIFFKFKKKIFLIILLCSVFSLVLASLYFSGNRMPFALFILANILILVTTKTLRRNLIFIILFFTLVFGSLIGTNKNFFNHYNAFFHYSLNILDVYKKRIIGEKREPNFLGTLVADPEGKKIPHHVMEFDTFYETWKMNPLIGGGIKSFRLLCPKRPVDPKLERTTCNTHPHNYYLEIFSEIGIVGFVIVFFIFLKIIYDFYFKFNNNVYKTLSSPFFYIFFIEAFPIKSSGSFFTTGNSLIIFLSMSFVVALVNKK